jgi:hypothetical protein
MWLIHRLKVLWGGRHHTEQEPLKRRSRARPWPKAYFVSSSVINATHRHLRREGRKSCEGLVYWAGWYEGPVCIVTTALIPRAIGRWGGVRVPTEEIIRIAELVRALDLLIVAQIHTHPGDHRHSGGDDVNAVSSVPGFLSIVVPNFDQFDILPLERCYFHRYLRGGSWIEIARSRAMDLVHIDPVRLSQP